MALSVALSGATSFTGLWIASHLAAQGFDVVGLCSKNANTYSGLPLVRKVLLEQTARVAFNIRAEDGSMARWIRENKPDIWIHHHHFMEQFRSPNYDVDQARKIGLAPLPEILDALADSSCQGLIFSGSYFEPGEGGQPPHAPVTPYAQSKADVWNALVSQVLKFPIAKVVIPNPIGPFENEDRLIPTLLKKALKKETFALSAPSSTAVNLPVFDLAAVYATAIESLNKSQNSGPIFFRPSCESETNKIFVERICRDFISGELGLVPPQIEFAIHEARITHYTNGESHRVQPHWDRFWSMYARVILSTGYLGGLAGA